MRCSLSRGGHDFEILPAGLIAVETGLLDDRAHPSERRRSLFWYGSVFDPKMAEAIGAITEGCRGILLGRTTYQMFEPAWSMQTVEDDPGAPFFNDNHQVCRLRDAHNGDVKLEDHRVV